MTVKVDEDAPHSSRFPTPQLLDSRAEFPNCLSLTNLSSVQTRENESLLESNDERGKIYCLLEVALLWSSGSQARLHMTITRRIKNKDFSAQAAPHTIR